MMSSQIKNREEKQKQNALAELRTENTPLEERFDRITRLTQQLFGVESAAISLMDHDRQWFKSRIAFDPAEVPRFDALCDMTMRMSEIFVVSDAKVDERFATNALLVGNPRIRFYAGYPLTTPSGERIGALCIFDPTPRTFSNSEKDLLRDIAFWVEKEVMLDVELNRAKEVQRGLLPRERLELRGYEVAGGCASARAVGGDFYDWYDVDEGEAFTLVDVMGKGMSAAIIAATVRAVLRAGSRSDDLERAVDIAADTLDSDLHSVGIFATLFHARLNASTGQVRYIDAGHGLSFVIGAEGTATRLMSEYPPLGTGIPTKWQEQSFTLEPGDTLVAISDGVLDLFGGTMDGLRTAEERVRNSSSAQAVVDGMLELAGTNPTDDVTILVVHRINPKAAFSI